MESSTVAWVVAFKVTITKKITKRMVNFLCVTEPEITCLIQQVSAKLDILAQSNVLLKQQHLTYDV